MNQWTVPLELKYWNDLTAIKCLIQYRTEDTYSLIAPFPCDKLGGALKQGIYFAMQVSPIVP